MRRSEIVGLDVDDLTFTPDGVSVRIKRSKTDQEAKGKVIDISRRASSLECPMRAVETWLARAAHDVGPLFIAVRGDHIGTQRLNGSTVARIVKRHVERVGLDRAKYSAHSLHAGFVTEADANDISDSKVMAITRHKSTTVLAGYKPHRPSWSDNATRLIKAVS